MSTHGSLLEPISMLMFPEDPFPKRCQTSQKISLPPDSVIKHAVTLF